MCNIRFLKYIFPIVASELVHRISTSDWEGSTKTAQKGGRKQFRTKAFSIFISECSKGYLRLLRMTPLQGVDDMGFIAPGVSSVPPEAIMMLPFQGRYSS